MSYETTTGKSIEQAFIDFHKDNPKVYEYFKKYVKQMIQSGCKKLSSKLIINRIRWEVFIETSGDDPYRINDAFTAHYSRLFIQHYPQYEDMFEFRRLRQKKELRLDDNGQVGLF